MPKIGGYAAPAMTSVVPIVAWLALFLTSSGAAAGVSEQYCMS